MTIFKKWRTTDGYSKSGKITTWSFSRFSDYIKCPFMAKLKHVQNYKEPEGPAILKGNLIHLVAEQFVRGDLKDLPKELKNIKALMLDLRKRGAHTEQSWCMTKDWQLCEWDDWNNVWVRMKIDAHYLVTEKRGNLRRTAVHVVDYKTGREYPDHALQTDLYAIGAFTKYPDAAEVVAVMAYTETGEVKRHKFTPKQVEALKERWELRTRALLTDTVFRHKPGDQCRRCYFRKSNGGPCQY